jgi:hypothetical protein
VTGLVPEPWEVDNEPEDDYELGNGDVPPQWGIDFVVFGGTMTYGPWADRQRFAPQILLEEPNAEIIAFRQSRLQSGVPAVHLLPYASNRETQAWRFAQACYYGY